MNNKKVSIIVPTYNRGYCIEKLILNIKNQKYKNWELIIIDDGSTDNTKKIVQKYLECNKIIYLYQENSGVTIARNLGIKKSSGEIIIFLDSDDELVSENSLEQIIKDLNNLPKNVGEIIYKSKNVKKSFIKKNNFVGNYKNEILNNYWSGELFRCIKSSIIKKNNIFYEEKCPLGLESIFWLRIAKITKVITKNIVLRYYNKNEIHQDNLTSFSSMFKRAKGMIDGYDILIKENKKEVLEIDKSILSKWYLEQFQWCIIDRQLKRGFKSWKNAIKFGKIKQKIKILIFGILFLIPKSLLPIILKFYYKTK